MNTDTDISDITLERIESCEDHAEIDEMKLRIELVMVKVKGQISKVKADIYTGKEIDNEWFARAKSFKNSMGFLHQRLLLKERKFNKERSFENWFMDAAREILPRETFQLILNRAHEKNNSQL